MPRGKSEWEPGMPWFPRGEKRKWVECEETGCWIWFGALNSKGRPAVRIGKQVWLAYRYFWEQERGPIPANKELDHFFCDNPVCVNLNHLILTNKTNNTARGNVTRHNQLLAGVPF